MKKLTIDDYLSCAVFTVIGCIFLGLAYMANGYEMLITTVVLVFLAMFSFVGSLWSLSPDLKKWK